MPISSFSIVSLIACELNYHKPATVLDLGCGSGFYGAVVRQYVDMGWGDKTSIEGVEPFAEYKTPNWGHYNIVWRRTIQDHLIFAKGTAYDCILFLDVIEHFKRLEGLSIMEQLMEKLSPGGVLFVSTPGVFEEQGAEYGNELEKHLSFYEPEDFSSRGFVVLKDGRQQDQFLQYMTVAKFINAKNK
jgi:2-polyprenyl-3-methyl-5-hydroxy-6-metoxy-1,4-benzoquinol methylase